MKIVVIGATGRVGRQVVRSAAQRGHDVVAFAHQPDPMIGPGLTSDRPDVPLPAQPDLGPEATGSIDNRVLIAPGDVFDSETLRAPVEGADAVVFAAGSTRQPPTRVRTAGIAAVCKVMRASGVSRLVAVSQQAAFISPRATLVRKIALSYFVQKLYRNPFLDVERMEDELAHSDLNWSIVRAAKLRDWPTTGNYRVVPAGQVRHEWPVGTADLADYIVTRATASPPGSGTGQAAGPDPWHDIVTVTGTGSRARPDGAAGVGARPGRQDSPGQPVGQPAQKAQKEGQRG